MRSRLFLAIGIAIEVASIVVTIISALAVHSSVEERKAAVFERQIDRGMQAAQSRLSQYQYALIAGAGLFNASDYVSHNEWEIFVATKDVDQNYPGISGFGFIRRVADDRLDLYQQQVSMTYGFDFSIKELESPSPEHRYIIEYIEPLYRNMPALGLDIGSNTMRREAAVKAMDTGRSQITDIIILVQDEKRKPGFLMLHPVYLGGAIPETIPERRQLLIGWVYAPFVGEDVMAGINDIAGGGVRFAIYDGERSDGNRIYDGGYQGWGDREQVRSVQQAGQEWLFVWRSDGSSDAGEVTDTESFYVMLSGFLTSTGLLVVMLLLHRDNRRAINAAQQALAAKTDFVSIMNHEIRTPLHGVIGMSELLQQQKLSPETEEIAETIRSSGESLLSLVNDILDLSRLEDGRVEIEHHPFDVMRVVAEVLQLFRKQADRQKVALAKTGPSDWWVMGDATRFRQILLNLVSNAIKFTEDGQVSVTVSASEHHLEIDVADTGIGMSEQAIEKLYEPFAQADASISRRFGGTGLGMSIVRGLVEVMNGSIACQSKQGQGTTFTIMLPLDHASESAVTGAQCSLAQNLGLHVLLAEDNSVNQRVAQAMLQKSGCSVVTVADGAAAIEAFEAHGQDLDLILMDCQMPVVDGLEATRRLRSAGCSLPILAFTANSGAAFKAECLAAGMNDFLTKPLKQEAMAAALQHWVTTMKDDPPA